MTTKDKELLDTLRFCVGSIRWLAQQHHLDEGHDTSSYFTCKARRCKQAAKAVRMCEEAGSL